MTEKVLINAGYKEAPVPVVEQYANRFFQKKIKDEKGIKYFIDVYEYKEIELEGVKFGLYANENITDGTGNVIYKKGDLVKEVLTDKDGNIKIDNLHLGKYYLQEIATVGNHVLDKTKYEFELKYKDQYTDTIEYTTSIKNHLASGKLEFTKIDFSTSKPLPDTKIELLFIYYQYYV